MELVQKWVRAGVQPSPLLGKHAESASSPAFQDTRRTSLTNAAESVFTIIVIQGLQRYGLDHIECGFLARPVRRGTGSNLVS